MDKWGVVSFPANIEDISETMVDVGDEPAYLGPFI